MSYLQNTPNRKTFLLNLLVLLCLCWLLPAHAAETTIEAQLEPGRIALGDGALLTLTIHGQRSADPELPDVEELRITPLGRSTEIQFINGSLSSGLTLTYRVQAARTGTFTIPPIRIKVEGRVLETRPLQLEVVASQGSSTGAGTGSTPVQPPSATTSEDRGLETGQLIVEPDKKEIYSGELLPITIRGYFRQDRRVTVKGQPTPAGNGFILESLDEEPVQEEIIKNGIRCARLTWHGAVSAIRQGQAKLQMTLPITVLVPERRQLPPGMFNDPFFDLDSFFTQYRKKEITLTSQPVSIQVMPLPEHDRPDDFSGAIGSFSLRVQAKPTTVKPGDPVNLTMTISGQGNFDLVKAPVFTGTEQDWKIYPPSRGEPGTEDAAHGGRRKTKKFEQVIIPRHAGIQEIPALRFSYFDPEKKQYRTVTSSPIPLHIVAGAPPAKDRHATATKEAPKTSLPDSASGRAPAQLQQDSFPLAPIHAEFGKGVRAVQPLWQKTWFQLVVAILVLLFMLSLILSWQRRSREQHAAITAEKIRQQGQMAQLQQLGEAAASGETEHFLSLLRQIIQDHFGWQWQGEARAITAADLAGRIGEDAPLTRLLRTAEHAVYAPPELSPAEMKEILAELKKELARP